MSKPKLQPRTFIDKLRRFKDVLIYRRGFWDNPRQKPVEEEYLMTSGDDDDDDGYSDDLTFTPGESVALCVGIDEQFYPPLLSLFEPDIKELDLQGLGPNVKRAANEMSQVCDTTFGIRNSEVITASDNSENCTKPSLSTIFEKKAKAVGENGIFVFYFAGHGCISPTNHKCVLVPTYYATEQDGISAYDLMAWLHNANCKAKNVLFIFDCCYAGNLGEHLIETDWNFDIKSSVSAMCACTDKEKSIILPPLQSSIFTYFLLDYLKGSECIGQFSIINAMQGITNLCICLSSLLYLYKKNLEEKYELVHCEMHPKHYAQRIIAKGPLPKIPKDMTGLEAFLQSLVREDLRSVHIPSVVDDWIKSTAVDHCLSELAHKAFTSEVLQDAIVCALLHTSALFLIDDNYKSVADKKIFLAIALKVKTIVRFPVKASHLHKGVIQYKKAITDYSNPPIDVQPLTDVCDKIHKC